MEHAGWRLASLGSPGLSAAVGTSSTLHNHDVSANPPIPARRTLPGGKITVLTVTEEVGLSYLRRSVANRLQECAY